MICTAVARILVDHLSTPHTAKAPVAWRDRVVALWQQIAPHGLQRRIATRAAEKTLRDALERLGALSGHLMTDIGYNVDGTLIEPAPVAVTSRPKNAPAWRMSRKAAFAAKAFVDRPIAV